jgi:DMSO/TMAO reductase YedYZ molybdopterin-dependent catalytic subunit
VRSALPVAGGCPSRRFDVWGFDLQVRRSYLFRGAVERCPAPPIFPYRISSGAEWAKSNDMRAPFKSLLTRREMLKGTALASGVLLTGFERLGWPAAAMASANAAFQQGLTGGRQLGLVEFAGEPRIEMDTVNGAELNCRLFTDLSTLTPENPIIPTKNFYIRTGVSKILEDGKPWSIQLGGLVEKPVTITQKHLETLAKPAGTHLMECAGNFRTAQFGLMSVAEWAGVPMAQVLESVKALPRGKRILVSGFDRYESESANSIPGASWIFTSGELKSTGAFLATQMNGEALTRDHGAPLRLVVPGWYGCTCIKWVTEIAVVDENAAATSQMQEYAGRTHQQGIPDRARDYHPAFIEHAAMPIRIEKWLIEGEIKYRVVGILWGGAQPVNILEIRFNPEEEYVRVEALQQSRVGSWNFWTHSWTPKEKGIYLIRLRVKDPAVPQTRLDAGYYVRSVEITEPAGEP